MMFMLTYAFTVYELIPIIFHLHVYKYRLLLMTSVIWGRKDNWMNVLILVSRMMPMSTTFYYLYYR